jgi:hypothetical protein
MNRNFAILPTTRVNDIDYSEVMETSSNTVRLSIDGSLFFVKWEGQTPESVLNIENAIYKTYEEMFEILKTPEWQEPLED